MIHILRFIDKYFGRLIIIFFSFFRKQLLQKENNNKFLVIKLWAIGDSILTLPLIKGIKETHKACEVDVLLRSRVKDVYECYEINHIFNLDSLSDIIKLARKYRSYDVVFDCEPYLNISAILSFLLGKIRVGFANQFRSKLYTKTVEFRKNQHMVQNYLDMLRVLNKNFDTCKLEKLSIPVENQKRIDEFLSKTRKSKPIIGITPGISESSKNRMWFENRFAELADKLIEEFNFNILFIDSKKNREIVNNIISQMKQKPINTVGMFNLKETFYLISKCNVYISNDTGPMHIAAAQGVKTIGLFGPNTPVLWGPYGEKNISIYKTKLEPAIQNDKGIFKNGNQDEYMGPISVDCVFDAVNNLLSCP